MRPMIFDVIEQSLSQPDRVIPVGALLGNCEGSRMPEVVADRLTPAIAEKLVELCPTAAFALHESDGRRALKLAYGRCIGCGRCVEAGEGAVRAAKRFALCGLTKQQMVLEWDASGGGEISLRIPWPEDIRGGIDSLLQRALNVRQLDGGSCNGCEAEIAALTNPYYDLERFGIHFVASPKHADMLLVTGPVTRNMAGAVRATYEAVPSPKLVVAVGACG